MRILFAALCGFVLDLLLGDPAWLTPIHPVVLMGKMITALEKLLPILTISCWGFVPEDMKIVFNPIRTMSAETQMKLATEHADIVLKALEKGAITRDEARAELKAYSAKTDMFAKLA